MNWPRYRTLSSYRISTAHSRFFFSDVQALKGIGIVFLAVAIYLFGIHLSLPFANIQQVQYILSQSEVLSALNVFFTGGALGNISPFAMGSVPLIFLYAGSVRIIGSRLRIQPRIRPKPLFIVTIMATLVTVWLLSVDAIPATILGFLATTLSMILGTVILFWLESKSAEHGGPDIVSLNALLIGVGYVSTLLSAINVGDLAMISLIGLFFLSFAFLVRKVDHIQVVNIKEAKVLEGRLPLPATNSFSRRLFLVLVLVVATAIIALVNFFSPLNISPFGDSLTEIALVATALLIAMLLLRNELFDDLLGQFNCTATAKRLRVSNWIIPSVEVDLPTAIFLRKRVARVHRVSHLFYFIWILLLSTVAAIPYLFNIRITPLPFGPLGFIAVLTLCSDIGYDLFAAAHDYIQRVNFKEFWTTPRVAVQTFELPGEIYGLNELFERVLASLPPEERRQLWYLTSGKVKIKDLIPILSATVRYLRQNPLELGLQTSADSTRTQPERERLTQLRLILASHFNKEELRTLCFDLGVNYDDLGDESNADIARELVAHLERHGRIQELEDMVGQLRPGILVSADSTLAVHSEASRIPAYVPERSTRTGLRSVLYRLLFCIVLSLVVLALVAGGIQLIFGQVFDAALKVGLLLFWVPMFFVFFEWFGLHQDMVFAIRQVSRRVNRKP